LRVNETAPSSANITISLKGGAELSSSSNSKMPNLRFFVLFLDFNLARAEFEPPAITDDITGFMYFSRFGLENIVKSTANSEEIGKLAFI